MLFTVNIEAFSEKELLKHPEELKADVLITPHHGSSEPTTAAFVKAVGASMILSSNDRSLTHKQVAFESMVGSATLLRTNNVGAITGRIDGQGNLDIETEVPPAKRK